jgi:tetratricopeptide (TPR) repeat protein
MSIQIQTFHLVVAAILLAVMNCAPVFAQSLIEERLLALRNAEPSEAARLSREIEREWSQSGSAAMNMLLRRGRDAMANDQLDIAIEHLSALTDHAPDFAEGWHARATAFYMKGLYGPALGDLQRALTLNPKNYNGLFGLGIMLQQFGDLRRAGQAFEHVLDLHPNHENASKALEQLKRDGIGREL